MLVCLLVYVLVVGLERGVDRERSNRCRRKLSPMIRAFDWLAGKMFGTTMLKSEVNSIQQEIFSLQVDLAVIEEVQQELFTEMNELISDAERERESKTCVGKVKNILGYWLSAYCVTKMTMAIINIVFQRKRRVDPISTIFNVIFNELLHVEVDVHFWSQQCSFVLVGIIVSLQMRGFLINIMKLFHAW